MEVIATIITIIVSLGTIYLFILTNRVTKVGEFAKMCNNLTFEWNIRHLAEIKRGEEKDAHKWFLNKVSNYNALLFSWKRLELESFFTQEEIIKILS